MGRVAVAHGIDLVDTFLVNIVLKSASWLLRFASLLEGVTARISISQTGGISVVHPVVGRADHGQESFGTLRVDQAASHTDSSQLSSRQFGTLRRFYVSDTHEMGLLVGFTLVVLVKLIEVALDG